MNEKLVVVMQRHPVLRPGAFDDFTSVHPQVDARLVTAPEAGVSLRERQQQIG